MADQVAKYVTTVHLVYTSLVIIYKFHYYY